MSTPNFRFKQFTIWHDKCAMKVGTDGVLIGCWPLAVGRWPIRRILDIGTGSGLVALMMAQRFPHAHIDAIEIDEAAVEQARENFEVSPFSFQLSAFNSSLQDWQGGPYDLIVSNPPYFQNSLKNPDKGRKIARHTDSLSYEELITHSVRLLTTYGQLALILPAEAEAQIRALAACQNLLPTHITRVYSKEGKPARRVLMSFIRDTGTPEYRNTDIDSLILEDGKGGRSAAYSELCKEFYL